MELTLSKTSIVPAHTELQLVAATRVGDDRAFEELYSRYRERILAFILSRVRDHGRAEDLVQEVFISALRRLRASDQDISFKPWIYEIAKNACIDEFRRSSRGREVPVESDGEPPAVQATTLSLLPTPVAAVESSQRMNDLRGAFGGLSESHHRLLVMREFEGRSYDEIGERLHMTRQMVESGLFRARRKLTEEYHELASGRRCQQVQLAIDTGALSSARSLGLRDRRRFARHLSHCQVCRNVALQGDVDEALVTPRRIAAKIAALLPFPLLRWPWRGHGRAGARAASGRGSAHLASSSLQNVAGLAEPATGSALTIGPAAVAAAALTIAGVGGALLHGAAAPGQTARAVTAVPAAAIGIAPRHSRPVSSPAADGGGVTVSGVRLAGAAGLAGRAATMSFAVSRPRPAGRRAPTRDPGAASRGTRAGAAHDGSAPAGTWGAPATAPARRTVPVSAPAPVLSVASAVGAATRHVVSITKHLGADTVSELSSAGAPAVAAPVKAIDGLVKTVEGVTPPAAIPPSLPSQPSSAGTSSTPTLSSVGQSVTQAVSQTAQGILSH